MKDTVVRFSRIQRLEHATVMSLFLLLALTGLPQKFFDHSWAQTLMGWLGGVDNARLFHRAAGVGFSLVVVAHLSRLTFQAASGRITLTLVPTKQDFRDAVAVEALAPHPAPDGPDPRSRQRR